MREKAYFESVPGAPDPITATIRHRLRFSEADALTIAWHGRYPAFFEEAQTELGRKCGLTYATLRAAGLMTPVAKLHIDYVAPIFYDEEFDVTASLLWSDGARINTEYAIRKTNGAIASRGYSVQLFVDAETRTPIWLEPELWTACKTRWKAGEFA